MVGVSVEPMTDVAGRLGQIFLDAMPMYARSRKQALEVENTFAHRNGR